jgi:hypothetical protein
MIVSKQVSFVPSQISLIQNFIYFCNMQFTITLQSTAILNGHVPFRFPTEALHVRVSANRRSAFSVHLSMQCLIGWEATVKTVNSRSARHMVRMGEARKIYTPLVWKPHGKP